MEKLTKLQLDNNIITKISGPNSLVNLKWLDLSFNLIEKIEGLENCTKLTDLSLFSNHITQLSGLENLKELNVLSVGSNKLKNLEDTIKYLQKLKNKLEVLRISNNQFQKQNTNEYKKYTIARLKDLKYFDYELIEAKDREQANEEHKDEMTNYDNEAGGDRGADDASRIDSALVEAKIECTVDIFGTVLNSLDEE